MPDRKVHVYESSDHEYRVEPKLVELKQGADTLKLRNHSNDELVFFVTSGAFNANNPQVTSLPPKALTTIAVPVSQGASGTLYVYQVMHPKSGKKAKANSDPVLIIEN